MLFRSTLHRADADVAALVRQAVDEVRPRALGRGLTIAVDAPPALPAYVDADRLTQVIAQLLSNAIKFTTPPGAVHVRVASDDDDVTIEVADTGMGIPADDLPRLFQRFTRATNAIRGAISGTGVGLAIVRQLIEMHGGAVSVESTEGAGATFRVRIPRRERAST